MDASGGDAQRLTFNGAYNTNPAWSPDGLWIAYETRVDGQFDLWLIDPEGKVNVPLVSNERTDEAPSWAPNSRHIVFSSTRRGRADLYMIDRDGSNLRRLTGDAGNNTAPAWARSTMSTGDRHDVSTPPWARGASRPPARAARRARAVARLRRLQNDAGGVPEVRTA
jgi:Tol biopolymer transport system component